MAAHPTVAFNRWCEEPSLANTVELAIADLSFHASNDFVYKEHLERVAAIMREFDPRKDTATGRLL